jgi:hypothetical protein
MAGLALLQAVTGVCCHHSCESAHDEPAPVERHCHSPCCHHAADELSDQAPAPVPCNEKHCFGFCTYISTSKVHVKNAWQCVAVGSPGVSAISLHSPLLGTVRSAKSIQQIFEPPLRLHLLHQIILI